MRPRNFCHCLALLLYVCLPAMLMAEPLQIETTNVKLTPAEEELQQAWMATRNPKAMPVENITLPLAHHADGRIKALLRAVKAWLPPGDEGEVRGEDVVIETFDENGRLDGIFITDNCLFNRITSDGYCQGKIRIEMHGLQITGADLVWNIESRNAKILSRPEVRINRFMQEIGKAFK